MRLVPTSITTAPSRTMSPVTRPAEPTAATSTSASRHTAGEVARARMAVGDGGVRCEQQLSHRLAHEDRAPEHDRSGAAQLDLRLLEQAHDARRACTGTSASSRPCMSRPGVGGGEAVHVLRRVDQADELVLVQVVGQRELEEDAVHPLVRVQPADQLRQLVRLTRRRPARGGTTRCRPRRSPRASCARRRRRPDRRRRGSSPGRACGPSSRPPRLTSSRTLAAIALPSMISAAMDAAAYPPAPGER